MFKKRTFPRLSLLLRHEPAMKWSVFDPITPGLVISVQSNKSIHPTTLVWLTKLSYFYSNMGKQLGLYNEMSELDQKAVLVAAVVSWAHI